VGRTEQRLRPVDRQLLDLVDDRATLVVAPSGIALGVLVGEDRPAGGHHGRGGEVLRGDQVDVGVLTLQIPADHVGHGRVTVERVCMSIIGVLFRGRCRREGTRQAGFRNPPASPRCETPSRGYQPTSRDRAAAGIQSVVHVGSSSGRRLFVDAGVRPTVPERPRSADGVARFLVEEVELGWCRARGGVRQRLRCVVGIDPGRELGLVPIESSCPRPPSLTQIRRHHRGRLRSKCTNASEPSCSVTILVSIIPVLVSTSEETAASGSRSSRAACR
jgi:hypothetical protein